MVSLILACGLICSVMLAVTGCSGDGSSGGKSSGKDGSKYQVIFDKINACDVDSSGSSAKILQTDFEIKNWLKDNAADLSGTTVSSSDAGDDLTKYLSGMNDKEKTAFGVKCQAVVDADLKLMAIFDTARAKAWGADVKEYDETDMALCSAFFESLQEGLTAEDIVPAAEYRFIDPTDDMEKSNVFDETTFFELISSISKLESGTAGSSYQTNLDTADFMQFVVDNAKCSEDTLKAGVEKCYGMLTPGEKLTFDWNLSVVLDAVDELLEDPTMITDMGKSVAVDEFTKKDAKKKLDTLVKVISGVSGVSYTD